VTAMVVLRGRAAATLGLILASLVGAACGATPIRAGTGDGVEEGDEDARRPARARRANLEDDCAPKPGKPPPAPLERKYEGVAAKARCQREVFTIMGGLTHFLGVKCQHCHEVPDYKKMTHNKHVANWMATQLIPSLAKQRGGELWCNDCHQASGEGKAKLLGDPRDPAAAAEWMAVHLTSKLETNDKNPLRCKSCHGANLGEPGFQRKIILTDRLPKD
jgi:hypothetical protein